MNRPHPFDFAFREIANAVFTPLRAELTSPPLADFAQRQEVSDLLDQIAPPDSAPVDPTVRGGMAQLAYLAYRFFEAGEQTIPLERAPLDEIISEQPPITVRPPSEPIYIQLPTRLCWGQIQDDAPHEPVDGIFVAQSGEVFCLAAILGFHPDRLGFSQFTTEVDGIGWAQAGSQIRQPPYAPMMDGGSQMGFYSIVSEAELIHLVQLALQAAQR